MAPGGSLGFRFGEEGLGRWNLELGDIEPVLTLHGEASETRGGRPAAVRRGEARAAGLIRRGVPATRIGGQLVTTVFDLLLAQYGVGRDGLPGEWPAGYDDASQPCTPAWQEQITGVPAAAAARVAREFAPQRRGSTGSLDDLHGRGDQPLVSTPTRSTGRSWR